MFGPQSSFVVAGVAPLGHECCRDRRRAFGMQTCAVSSSKLSASLISSKLSASLISSHSSHSSFGVGLASLTFPVFAAHDALVVPEVRSRAWAVRLGVLVPALGAGLVVAQLAPSALGTQGHRELGAEGVPAPTGPFASDVLVPALGAGLVVAQLGPSALGEQVHRELGAKGLPAPTGPFESAACSAFLRWILALSEAVPSSLPRIAGAALPLVARTRWGP